MPLAEVDGVCFPLAYLFLGKVDCGDGIRTGVIINFLLQLKCAVFNLNFSCLTKISQKAVESR